MVRGWHIRKDATAAKRGHSLTCWSRFQLAWERKRNSMQALALADGPALSLFLRWARPLPPGDGEDSGDAANDAAWLSSAPKLKKRWKPRPHRQQQDCQVTAFVKDSGGSEMLLLPSTDWWFGWTELQTSSRQAAGSSDAALRER